MSQALITGVFGSFDSPPPLPPGFDEYVLVSDAPIDSEWVNVILPTAGFVSDRLASKIPKFRPDLFVESEFSVWMDATVRDPQGWLSTLIETYLVDHEIALFRHPDRNDVWSEIKVSEKLYKYSTINFPLQYARLKERGFMDDVGLMAGTVLARRHCPATINFGNQWMMENLIYGIQDQVSLPFVLGSEGLRWRLFEEHLWDGPIKFVPHRWNDYEFPSEKRCLGFRLRKPDKNS